MTLQLCRVKDVTYVPYICIKFVVDSLVWILALLRRLSISWQPSYFLTYTIFFYFPATRSRGRRQSRWSGVSSVIGNNGKSLASRMTDSVNITRLFPGPIHLDYTHLSRRRTVRIASVSQECYFIRIKPH